MTSYQQPSYQQPTTDESDATMKDKATEAMGQGRQAAGQVAQTATEQAQEVKQEAVKQARNLVGEVRDHVSQQVGGQHQNLVANLRSLSSELGSMVDRSEQSGTASELVSQARERVDGVANWLDGREPSQLLDEVRSFARRRPGTFLLGALAAGMAVGRLARGAVAAHSEQQDASSGQGAAPGMSLGVGEEFQPPTSTYEPGTGYAHTTGTQTGYQGSGTVPGYSTGGSYADPASGPRPGNAPGYGATSTYGDGGTQAYPAGGYPEGGGAR